MKTFSTQQITDLVGGTLTGPEGLQISGIQTLDLAVQGELGFVREPKYTFLWQGSKASAVITTQHIVLKSGSERAVITVPDVDHALADVLEAFRPPPHKPDVGIHSSATIDPSAQIQSDVAVGPNCVVGPDARIGHGTVLHPGVVLGGAVKVGSGCEIFTGVVIGDRCWIGDHVTIHPNAVIGADGFGYLPALDDKVLRKVPQIGTVKIGCHVEIGAGTCIDRGKFAATVVGDGTKIDNLCHIGHNCRIGRYCLLAAEVGLAGSVVVEDGVMFGGKSGVADHLTVGAGAKIGGAAGVTKDVPPGSTWWGCPAHDMTAVLRETLALRRLPGVLKELRKRGNPEHQASSGSPADTPQ